MHHRVPDSDPVNTHVSALVSCPVKLIAIAFPARDPVKVPLPLPIADAKVKEPMRSLPAVALPAKVKLTVLVPVNVPVPEKSDPVWLPMFTVDEKPGVVPLFAGFWQLDCVTVAEPV
jgi:hypothetical protein